MTDENILVVRRKAIFEPLLATGLFRGAKDRLYSTVLANYEFMPRAKAETDEAFKQIIPYVVVRHESKFLLLRRTKMQGEARLHGKLTIGVGGHLNDQKPEANKDVIMAGLFRELREELNLPFVNNIHYVGYVNDEESVVGRVHLGLVFFVTSTSPIYEVRERSNFGDLGWLGLGDLSRERDKMESWSQFVFDREIKQNSHYLC